MEARLTIEFLSHSISSDRLLLPGLAHSRTRRNWDDEHSLKLLKNCWKALPESGKAVLVEVILPEHPESDVMYGSPFYADMLMMTMTPGAWREAENAERI
nr:caffeic acid 3-O-methyltransferase-like [Ipomoea batatas]GME17017.1 caffeic acid 3-O-methyltransferase-like [Ipomoea batatas]